MNEQLPAEPVPPKPTLVDTKRARIYAERRQRLIGQGVPEDKVDMRIAEEDYAALPLERKFEHLQKIVVEAINGFRNDLMALQSNDRVLANALDVNLNAIAAIFEKLGVSKEEQKNLVLAAEAQMNKERPDLQMEANAEGAPPPEEATVFGG